MTLPLLSSVSPPQQTSLPIRFRTVPTAILTVRRAGAYSIIDASRPRPFKNMLTFRNLSSAFCGKMPGARADWTVCRI